MPTKVLSLRALNRAALARQLLLMRAELPVVAAIRRVVGVNAQAAKDPYLWLWARLADFRIDQLTEAIEVRQVVRSTTMRVTQHLVAADDFWWVRSVLQPLLARTQRNIFARGTTDVDLDELVGATRDLLAGRSLYRAELGRLLEARWPGRDRTALAWSAQYLEPIVHPVSSGSWHTSSRTKFTLAADWLGAPRSPDDGLTGPQRLVRRYLAAYGPATTSDIRAWSGVSGLREAVDSQRSELQTFTDSGGRELVDIPDGPRPEADTPAPVRLLPEFDNLMLAYADRTRIMSDDVRRQVCVGDGVAATVLIDGFVDGTWST